MSISRALIAPWLRVTRAGVLLVCSPALVSLQTAAQQTNAAAYTWTTFAGRAGGYGSADGVGSQAQFASPYGVAVGTNGSIYVADTVNSAIRKVTAAGVVSTIAGFAGSPGSADGTNSAARFAFPTGIAVDNAGNLYVADRNNSTIRKIRQAGTNWVVSTFAGQPGAYGTNDGPGTTARFGADGRGGPAGVAVDSQGNLYVSDFGNNTIRKISAAGQVTTIAGQPDPYNPVSVDGTNNGAHFSNPQGVAVAADGSVYVVESSLIRKVTPMGNDWVVTTIAGSSTNSQGYADGTNGAAKFFDAYGVAVDGMGGIYVADVNNHRIRKITPVGTDWVVSTLAGTAVAGSGDGTGTNALFFSPHGVAVDGSGNVYVADTVNNTIRKVTSAGVVRTVAGLAESSGSADGNGRDARFYQPRGVAIDSAGNIYVADTANQTIRQITSVGVVSTLAGSVTNPGSADGAGGYARFNSPSSAAVDRAGTVYVADTLNHAIRQITAAGVVSTIAGSTNAGWADEIGTNARFNSPAGVALDRGGNMYVADSGNFRIRRVAWAGTNWVVTTIAGSGASVMADGTNGSAGFSYPMGIAVDSATNLYVADGRSPFAQFGGPVALRTLAPSGTNWVVRTIAIVHYLAFFVPSGYGLAVEGTGSLYLADSFSVSISKFTQVGTNWLGTFIGGSNDAGSADGAGSAARFGFPTGIAVDSAGNVYVADTGNNTIRKGVFTGYAATNPVAYTRPAMNGQLVVTLLPPEANGQWRFPWELSWRASGQAASNLAQGNYAVEFRNVPGWLPFPPNVSSVPVTNNGTTSFTNYYYPTLSSVDATNTGGSLSVNIGPSPPSQAAWHFLGDSTYFPPGYSTNLLPGTYLIGFRPVGGYSTPPNLSVQIHAGQPTVVSLNYLLAASPPDQVLLPVPVPTNSIGDLSDYPFGFNGQLQSEVGYGSGVAVQPNVVLTAAHLVFDDQNLSYAARVWWFFQQETGVFAPLPQQARASYILSGYAAQRTNDLRGGFGVDQSSAASRNLDVAALYFQDAVAGGGYGGYLPSDTVPNSWLTSTSLKMLVGYPVDGSLFGDASIVPGLMYQTSPQPYPLNLAPDSVSGQQEVYTASWFLSYPGNSGGPLYVQFNGYYYPAGVYLGTLYNGSTYASAVRAIDSNVVAAISIAQGDAGMGTNNTGGGVITFVPNQELSAANPAYVQVVLGPAAAVQAGAGWRLQGDGSFGSSPDYTRTITTNGAVLEFNTNVAGWNPPASQTVQLTIGDITVISNVFYKVKPPSMVADRALGIGLSGTTNTTYRIEYRPSLGSGQWLALRTNTLRPGFNQVLPWPPTNGPAGFYRAVWLP